MGVMNILDIILPTFIVILLGFIIGKTTRIDISSIVDIAFYIGLPPLVFVSMLNKEIVLIDASKVWAAAMIIMLGCGVVAWAVFKIFRQKHSGLYIPIMMMNTVNIQVPRRLTKEKGLKLKEDNKGRWSIK